MNDFRRIEEMTSQEIEAALDAVDADLDLDRLLAVAQFVDRIGGIANARLAVEMLGELEDAA